MLRYTLLMVLFLGSFHFAFANAAQLPQVVVESPAATTFHKTTLDKANWDHASALKHFLSKNEAHTAPDEIKKNALLSFIIGVGSAFSVLLAFISPYFLILFVGASLIGFILSLSTYRRVKDQPKYRVQRNLALAGLIGSLAIWAFFVLFLSFSIALSFISPD